MPSKQIQTNSWMPGTRVYHFTSAKTAFLHTWCLLISPRCAWLPVPYCSPSHQQAHRQGVQCQQQQARVTTWRLCLMAAASSMCSLRAAALNSGGWSSEGCSAFCCKAAASELSAAVKSGSALTLTAGSVCNIQTVCVLGMHIGMQAHKHVHATRMTSVLISRCISTIAWQPKMHFLHDQNLICKTLMLSEQASCMLLCYNLVTHITHSNSGCSRLSSCKAHSNMQCR